MDGGKLIRIIGGNKIDFVYCYFIIVFGKGSIKGNLGVIISEIVDCYGKISFVFGIYFINYKILIISLVIGIIEINNLIFVF